MDDDLLSECADDKQIKMALVIDTITKKCGSSPHRTLQEFNHAIVESGRKLEATILPCGYTNYPFKVFIDKHPDLCIFAKLCFEYALWNPDRGAHYDLQRTENESEIMKTMSNEAPGCVVAPLACWDIKHEGQNMKLLLTEWSNADDQFSNQFISGAVDPRIAPKVADTLAKLHCVKDFDPDFNVLVKPCMENMLENQMKDAALKASTSQNPNNRTEAYCAALGVEIIMNIIESAIVDYHKRDCLIHSDAHVFNIIVEAKPSVEESKMFGPNGTMVLCDWEMARAGPMGHDIGMAMSFPIGCMIAHTLNCRTEANESITVYINALLDAYLSRMAEVGKTPKEMARILRNAVGWCGWFQYLPMHQNNVQGSAWPVESDHNKRRLRDALGILGLKFMRLSYDTDYIPVSASMEDIRKLFNSLWGEEIARASDASVG